MLQDNWDYKKWYSRVTEVVDFFYPFKGTWGYWQFIKWLKRENIEHDDYMNTACSLGTLVHKAMEYYINWTLLDDNIPKVAEPHIMYWKERFDKLKPDEVYTEHFVKNDKYQYNGTIDIVYKKDWKWVLSDIKTYWIAKLPYDLAPWTLAVDKKKREKVNLQMSLYAYALWQQGIKIEGLELVYLHTSGIRVYEMQPLSKKEIKKKLDEYISYKEKEKKKEKKPLSLSNIFFN